MIALLAPYDKAGLQEFAFGLAELARLFRVQLIA